MTTFLTPDYEFQPKKKEHNSAQRAWEYLSFKDLIFAGSIIEREDIESALGVIYEKENWKFIGPFILLKNRIESEGFFITQRGLDAPSFRILTTEEMADYAQKKLMQNCTSNFNIAYTMAAHDTSKLNDKDKKKHKAIQNKAAQSALLQQKMLFDDRYF
jgi:hypothetical protein